MTVFLMIYYFLGIAVVSAMYARKILYCVTGSGNDCRWYRVILNVLGKAVIWPYVFARA